MATRSYKLKTRRMPTKGIHYDAHLNAEQLAVVMADPGPLMVLAGAGSGKTRALTYRVARLIEQGVPPESIVLVTFTNRAAKEMLGRVEELVGSASRRVLGGTFHHIANRILREHAELIGYGPNFTILSRDDAKEAMAAAIIDAGVQVKKGRFPKADVLINIASGAINMQCPVEDVIAMQAPRFMALTDDISAVCRAFIERKTRMNVMDFDDLLMNWKILLEEVGPVGTKISARTKAILVDEYQDTNRLQADIVDLMAKVNRNITVVGDDSQSIYRFRGADVRNMLEFEKRYPKVKRLSLLTNYRSTPQVLALANATLRYATEGFKKTLRAIRPEGELPALVPCRDVYQQADFIAQRVLEWRDEGISLDEVAVLYRAHHQSMELQVELMRRGIPFVVRSGMRFFEQAHVRDVIAHLKLVYNPDDELSFRRAVKLQDGVGNATADTLWRRLHDVLSGGQSAWAGRLGEALIQAAGGRAKGGVERFVRLIGELAAPKMRAEPGEMIRAVLDGFYGDHLLRQFQNGQQRQEDIAQLADYAAGFENLEALLQELALVQEFVVEETVGADEPDEKMTLSSIHQAKGLEWGRVVVLWLAEGRFPSDLSLREEGGVEEERRLFYVATTRAQDELVMTYPQVHRERDHTQVLMRRSRFVDELEADGAENDDPLFETWLLEEEFSPELTAMEPLPEVAAPPPPPGGAIGPAAPLLDGEVAVHMGHVPPDDAYPETAMDAWPDATDAPDAPDTGGPDTSGPAPEDDDA